MTTTTQHRHGVSLFLLLCLCSMDTAVLAFAPTSTTIPKHSRCLGNTCPTPSRRRVNHNDPASNMGILYVSFNDQQQQDKTESSSSMSDLLSKKPPLSPPDSINTSRDESTTETWVDESKHVELVGLLAWMGSISAFILMNNFMGPWPASLQHVPERIYFLGHMLGAMLFGGGIVLTTCIEWMVAKNKNPAVMQFWFDKVPLLDMALVLPGLTLSMVSGTVLTIVRYGGLALAPPHIVYAFWALVAFAAWWALTDLTTQGSALNAVMEAHAALPDEADELESVPDEVSGRTISNVGSCLLVLLMYGIMVMKPGTLHYF